MPPTAERIMQFGEGNTVDLKGRNWLFGRFALGRATGPSQRFDIRPILERSVKRQPVYLIPVHYQR